MALAVTGVRIGADKNDAAAHGWGAITHLYLAPTGSAPDIRDICDPADAILFGCGPRGAGVERMQLVIALRHIVMASIQNLAPRSNDEHIVPCGSWPPVIIIPMR